MENFRTFVDVIGVLDPTKADFISELPPEVSQLILRMLDPRSLLCAARVSAVEEPMTKVRRAVPVPAQNKRRSTRYITSEITTTASMTAKLLESDDGKKISNWTARKTLEEANFTTTEKKNNLLYEKKMSRPVWTFLVSCDANNEIWWWFTYGVGVHYDVRCGFITSNRKYDTIENISVPERDVVFQHDNVPGHCAKSVKNWLQTQPSQIMEWPAQNPDINPIENVWSYLKMKL
nr:uncharacterized protein LOC117221850 [Megalopta genalis]